MPFTVSHVAFVLPLRRTGLRLPLCGLAVGAMSPDLEYVVAGYPQRTISHSVFGIVTLDLALALGVLVGATLAAPGLGSLVPARHPELQQRLSRWRAPLWPLPDLARLVLAIIVGATSHVLIDGFTHASSFPAREIPLLAEPTAIRGWSGAEVLQNGLSLLGALVLARVVWRWLDEIGVQRAVRSTWTPRQLAVLAAATGAMAMAIVHDQVARSGLVGVRNHAVLTFLSGARVAAVVALLCGLALHPRLRVP